MKKILVAAVAALLSLAAVAATLNPIQLLNPAGSTAGQVISSTGPSTPPAWAALTGLHVAVTTSPLSQFAATTSAQLAGVLSDETGTGVAVFGTSPTITTPNIVGGTVAAGSGFVGQPLTNSTTGTPLTTNLAVNATSLTLPAGVWLVQGACTFTPAGTTTTSYDQCGIGTVSGAFPAPPGFAAGGQAPNGTQTAFTTLPIQYVLTTSTVIYLTAVSGFAVSTSVVRGDIIGIRIH